jgi:transposase InsO family protein
LLLEWPHEKRYQQLAARLGAPLIRHLLAAFRSGTLSAQQVAVELKLCQSRVYQLYADYLRACAQGRDALWQPGVSGGDHRPDWPAAVTELLRKRLTSRPSASYSFAASEAHRLCGFTLHRAQVRRWAIENRCAQVQVQPRPKAPVRRWQRTQIGELWQLDASPHRWFSESETTFPMLNMLDDCSRLFVGSRLYPRELLLAYFDFLPAAFLAYGLPLELYVDYHSLFFTAVPDHLTQLGAALRFYGVSLRYAPTPQAKGKVEREHLFWQGRAPAYFASEQITEMGEANRHLDALRQHRNRHEIHRELGMTPQAAWERARREKRSVLRLAPRCPWWPYIWSERRWLKVGADGRVPIGTDFIRLEQPLGAKVILCRHPNGHHSILAHPPHPKAKPVLLFTDRPQ